MGRPRHGPAAARRPSRGTDRLRRGGRGGRGLAAAAARCAMPCARGGSTRRETMLADATTVLDQRAAITTAPAAAGLTVAGHAADGVREPRRFRERHARGDRRAGGDRTATTRPSQRGGPPPTRIEAIGLWGRTPRRSRPARTLFAAGDAGRFRSPPPAPPSRAWTGAAEARSGQADEHRDPGAGPAARAGHPRRSGCAAGGAGAARPALRAGRRRAASPR